MTQTLNIGAVTSLALGVVFAFATPASAAMNSSAMVITNLNGGAIISGTTATANTGGNTAGGSRGGNGGSAGDVEAEDGNMNNGGAAAGNGGNGGTGSTGGEVKTGKSTSAAGSLNVLNTNTATVTNSVVVRAGTGENTASSTGDGGALVDSGDAYAAANVLNLVNTNMINSNYLLVSFNNFGSLGGNITLPDSEFFSQLFANGGVLPEMNSSTYTVNNTNDVDFTGTTTAQG